MKHLSTFILSILASYFSFSQAPPIQWQKSCGGSLAEAANVSYPTKDGGTVFAGFTTSNNGDVAGQHGNMDVWIVKLSATGVLEWQRSLGGTDDDFCCKVQETSDGGYIAIGWTRSFNGNVTTVNYGREDYWVIKLNSSGNIIWTKTLGGSKNDFGIALNETADGGYIVAGQSISFDGDVGTNNGNYDCFITKMKNNGDKEWTKVYGGSGIDVAQSIIQTKDGGYAIAGFSTSSDGAFSGNHGESDCWILKLTVDGAMSWQKLYGGSKSDTALSIYQTDDSGYIISGWASSSNGNVTGNHGLADAWVLKLNSTGSLEWQKAYGGSGADLGYYGIRPTSDGGYVFCASTNSTNGDITGNHGGWDFWIVKITGTGNIIWQKTLGGSADDFVGSVSIATDGGYILAGGTYSQDGDVTGQHGAGDAWVVKLAADITLPLKLITFSAIEKNNTISIEWETQNENGLSQFVLQKSTDGTRFIDLQKMAANNNSSNKYSLTDNGPVNDKFFYRLKMINQDGGITYSYILLVKPGGLSKAALYPNPAKDHTTITYQSYASTTLTITLTDLTGKMLLQRKVACQSGAISTALNTSLLPAGAYYIKLVDAHELSKPIIMSFIK